MTYPQTYKTGIYCGDLKLGLPQWRRANCERFIKTTQHLMPLGYTFIKIQT